MTARRLSRVTVSWLLALIVVVCALAYGAIDDGGPRTNADRTFDIARTIACPLCDGQSVAESDVAIAREIRHEISQLVDQGVADDVIRQRYVDSFGEDTLLTPPSSGLAGLVWVIPVVGVVAAAALLGFAMSRPGHGVEEASDADRELVDEIRDRR